MDLEKENEKEKDLVNLDIKSIRRDLMHNKSFPKFSDNGKRSNFKNHLKNNNNNANNNSYNHNHNPNISNISTNNKSPEISMDISNPKKIKNFMEVSILLEETNKKINKYIIDKEKEEDKSEINYNQNNNMESNNYVSDLISLSN